MKVLVVHPGLQHSYQLAWALEEADILQGFWSGIPVLDCRVHSRVFFGLFHRRLHAVPISVSKRKHFILFPLLRRLFELIPFRHVASNLNYLLLKIHDLWISWRIRSYNPDVVVCYENAALYTFRAASSQGIICILDAASVHYRAGNEWLTKSESENSKWIESRKQEEIELADAILTCSDFAAETYREAGVSGQKIFPVPLGTKLLSVESLTKIENEPCAFVFVGKLSFHKGVDFLLDIFESFRQENISARLTLIGGIVESDFRKRINNMTNVKYFPFMTQSKLFLEIANHQCLVLPSRFDSFGMVVPEAMSVGVPVIVSERVGAKCIIEQHPEAGWVVPCEKEAFRLKMIELIEHQSELLSASSAAKIAAQDYSWESYRFRAAKTIRYIYSSHGAETQ